MWLERNPIPFGTIGRYQDFYCKMQTEFCISKTCFTSWKHNCFIAHDCKTDANGPHDTQLQLENTISIHVFLSMQCK